MMLPLSATLNLPLLIIIMLQQLLLFGIYVPNREQLEALSPSHKQSQAHPGRESLRTIVTASTFLAGVLLSSLSWTPEDGVNITHGSVPNHD